VTVEAYPGRPFRGTVSKIEPQAVVDQNVTMFPVLIELANPERLLKPGMNAEVSVSISRRDNAVTVPNEAVVSPREAASAGAALGLDEQKLRDQMSQMRNAARGGRPAPEGPDGGPPNDRPQGAWGGRRGGSGGPGEPGGRGSWRNGGGLGGGHSAASVQPGVVFVKGPQGPEPKFVLLGLSDWDYTEVIRGLNEGDQVYLISVARLKQQQTQFADRMRQRAGGGMFGGGQQQGGQQGGGRGSGGGGR
jgi:HlyD family secretion protein